MSELFFKGPQEQYTDDLKKRFGYYATWLPGVPLMLGDVGILKDKVFTRIASLEDFQIAFDIREDNTPDDLEYSSKGEVQLTTKASGAIAPTGSSLTDLDAGFIVEFGKKNSILFKANGAKNNMIENTKKMGETILRLYKEGKWNKKWVVVTELVEAESATILISNSKNAKIELKANANANAPGLDIADAKFEFGASLYKGLDTKIVAQEGLTPLFKVQGIKTRWFLPPVFRSKGVKAMDLITPDVAKGKHKDDIYFSYISEDERE